MKIIKLGLISVVIIFSIITCMGLLLPSHVNISRTIDINQSPDSILPYINNFFGWKKWVNALAQTDIKNPNKIQFGKSSINLYNSNKTQVNGAWIDADGKEQKTTIQLIEKDKITIVNWQFEYNVSWFPLDRFSSIVNDKVTGRMMEDNLAALKILIESKQ